MAKSTLTIGDVTFTALAHGAEGDAIGISVGIASLGYGDPTFGGSGVLYTAIVEADGTVPPSTTSQSTNAEVVAAANALPAFAALAVASTTVPNGIFPYSGSGYSYLSGGSDGPCTATGVSSSRCGNARLRVATAAASGASTASITNTRARGFASTINGVSTGSVDAFALIGAKITAVGRSTATVNAGRIRRYTITVQGLSDGDAKSGRLRPNTAISHGTSSAVASTKIIRVGLTVCDVVRDILLCWGIEQPCSAPEMAKIAALNVLNNGMQVLWNQAKDRNYWTQSTLSIAFASGTDSVVMDQTIQNVIGPARLSTGEPLVPLANISESESFSSAFLEESSPTRPVGYFVERNNQSGADPAKCTMILSPVPSSNITVRVDVVKEAPRYTILDLDSCPLCPVPHKYVESILMPVCRYLSMHSHLYTNRESEKTIERAYIEARRHLDVADPLPGQSGENSSYRKEEA